MFSDTCIFLHKQIVSNLSITYFSNLHVNLHKILLNLPPKRLKKNKSMC